MGFAFLRGELISDLAVVVLLGAVLDDRVRVRRLEGIGRRRRNRFAGDFLFRCRKRQGLQAAKSNECGACMSFMEVTLGFRWA
jgi:hypothetical protein